MNFLPIERAVRRIKHRAKPYKKKKASLLLMNERYFIIPTMFGSEREIIENELRGLKINSAANLK